MRHAHHHVGGQGSSFNLIVKVPLVLQRIACEEKGNAVVSNAPVPR
jgi:hypothetical protein